MSNKSIKRKIAFLAMCILSISVMGLGVIVSGQDTQNSNSSPSMAGSMSNSNSTGKKSSKGKRKKSTSSASADTSMAGGMQDTTATGTTTDLSGTYTGTVNYPDGGITGPATLTITGNNFTLTPEGGGTPVTGRISAVTTRGYTGVAMQMGSFAGSGGAATAPPASVS